jgi:signal transduction histidine kinase
VKLARKLALALFLGVFAVLALHAYVRVRREFFLFENDIRHDSHVYGRALAAAVAEVYRIDGKARALNIVERADQRENHVRIRWVVMDVAPGSADSPAVPSSELAAVVHGEEYVAKVPYLGDLLEEHLITYVPLMSDGQSIGAIELAESLRGEKQYVRTTLKNTLFATLGIAAVCGVLATALGVWIVGRPMRRLVEQARRIGEGNLSQRLELAQRDEIGDLAVEMNLMCDQLVAVKSRVDTETAARITALEQLRHVDRLATVGKLAAGIAHELGAPLQVIAGRARMLLDDDVTPGDVDKNSRIIIEQADRITGIVRQLLDFARRRSAQKSQTDLRSVVRQPLALLAPFADKRSVSIALDAGESPIDADVDSEQIQQTVTNLVVNGIQAMKKGGQLRVSVRKERIVPPSDIGGPESTFACVEVEDEGEGIPSDVAAHVFEPFFTTKDVGEGTGLGLSVAYGIVREHDGFIRLSSVIGKGSRFCVYLPMGGQS